MTSSADRARTREREKSPLSESELGFHKHLPTTVDWAHQISSVFILQANASKELYSILWYKAFPFGDDAPALRTMLLKQQTDTKIKAQWSQVRTSSPRLLWDKSVQVQTL
ncbi:hypothetical protein BaRGS_00017489 [Batillaria attramentaria]|uniref:Uncharacterized protein n=1 Tax=Batillaria attramentaria TaxID=370345 RepID=A0ABD0KVQ0_9CAEN